MALYQFITVSSHWEKKANMLFLCRLQAVSPIQVLDLMVFFFECIFFSKINIKIKIKRMPHGTRYRVGLHISCCQTDWFPPIFQSFKNKNKWRWIEPKNNNQKRKKHSGDHDIYHFRSFPFKHAYIKNTTGISTYSSLNIRGGTTITKPRK